MFAAERVGVDPNTFHRTNSFQDYLAGRCNSLSILKVGRERLELPMLISRTFTVFPDAISGHRPFYLSLLVESIQIMCNNL